MRTGRARTPRRPAGAPVTTEVPRGLRLAAALCWRVLVVAGVLGLLWQLCIWLYELVIPVAVAVLLAALLLPVVRWLTAKGVPRTLASVFVLIGGLAIVGAVLTWVIGTVVSGWPRLQAQVAENIGGLHRWLRVGPLQLSERQLNDLYQRITDALGASQAGVASRALITAGAVAGFLAGALLGLFTLFFLLRDSGILWRSTMHTCVPARLHRKVEMAGRRAFASLVALVRATAAVAFMDALGVGIGTAIVGVPLAPVLAALVFLGAFVPYVGSLLAGAIAVLVATATKGLVAGLIVLAIVVGVMQLEGHVLQPLFLGRAVRVHPVAVVFGITAGFLLGGVAGALFAVPIVAVINAAVRSWRYDTGEPSAIDPYNSRHATPSQNR